MSNEPDHFRHDPRSMDSMFSRIMERLEAQDRMHVNARDEQRQANEKIIARIDASDARTTLLERWKDVSDARVTVIGAVIAGAVSVGAWLIEHFGGKSGS